MNIRNFFTGRVIGLIAVIVVVAIVAGFYALNDYIYEEKQAEVPEEVTGETIFNWRYEEDDSLNLDGNPQTNIFLDVKYPNGTVHSKLIDTTPGSCNALPEVESDSVPGTTNIQCYSAGLGYRFKITEGENTYLVKRKTFEEALPDYNPPPYEYELMTEFDLSK